ncbi:MAG: hypothetical protein GC155_10400 [Alphaproteobacteria bacterium]|nr:hypothetical protein [Alphaproteobacteria bacterium]
MLRTSVTVAGLLGVIAAGPAWADDLKGQWLFDTSTFDGDCMIKGQMTFTPTSSPNSYTCVFVSEQVCGPLHPELRSIKVQQDCTATKIGSQVAVKSVVNHVISRTPMIENPQDYYLADNFIVTMSKSRTEMRGGHYDEQRQLKAHFWRDVDLIS